MVIDASTLSLFTSANTTGADPSSSLLSALYGNGGAQGAAPGNGIDPATALTHAEASETKDVAATAKQPLVARDIAAFRAAVARAKTPAELLADPTARKVLLTANGLGDQTQYAALATKALLSDTSKSGSLASELPDTQWLATAKTFDFANQGLNTLRNPAVLDSIANGYAEVQWRQQLDASTPGLSDALTFRGAAANVSSAYGILGDSTLRKVVTTALGIPEQIAFQPLEAQAKAITDKLDVSKLKDPKFVEQFARRYLLAVSTSNADANPPSLLI